MENMKINKKQTIDEMADDAPVLPQESEENEIFSADVQKELEAKFDELFGPIDEN